MLKVLSLTIRVQTLIIMIESLITLAKFIYWLNYHLSQSFFLPWMHSIVYLKVVFAVKLLIDRLEKELQNSCQIKCVKLPWAKLLLLPEQIRV